MFNAIGNAPRVPLIRRILEGVKRAAFRWNEMQGLDSREIGLIASELNLSVAELNALAFSSSRSVELLNKRLAHAGLSADELAAFHGDVVRDLRRVCSQCPSKARCARDLRRERRATPSKYCPNEQTLCALSFEASDAPAAKVLVVPASHD